jgi:hypothetical protein
VRARAREADVKPSDRAAEPGPYRVLVASHDGATRWETVTFAQYYAYCCNDPNWRAAKAGDDPTRSSSQWKRSLR